MHYQQNKPPLRDTHRQVWCHVIHGGVDYGLVQVNHQHQLAVLQETLLVQLGQLVCLLIGQERRQNTTILLPTACHTYRGFPHFIL